MIAPKYPIGTIYQMADIPADALPRFFSELPAIISHIKLTREQAKTFNEAFEGAFEMVMGEPSWTDDDLGEATVSVKFPDGDKLEVTRKFGDPA